MIGLEKGRGGLSLANDGMGICSVKIRVPFFLESGVNTRYRTSDEVVQDLGCQDSPEK